MESAVFLLYISLSQSERPGLRHLLADAAEICRGGLILITLCAAIAKSSAAGLSIMSRILIWWTNHQSTPHLTACALVHFCLKYAPNYNRCLTTKLRYI